MSVNKFGLTAEQARRVERYLGWNQGALEVCLDAVIVSGLLEQFVKEARHLTIELDNLEESKRPSVIVATSRKSFRGDSLPHALALAVHDLALQAEMKAAAAPKPKAEWVEVWRPDEETEWKFVDNVLKVRVK